jgi:hypothetical protein
VFVFLVSAYEFAKIEWGFPREMLRGPVVRCRSMGANEGAGTISHINYPAAATEVCCLLVGAVDEVDESYTRINQHCHKWLSKGQGAPRKFWSNSYRMLEHNILQVRYASLTSSLSDWASLLLLRKRRLANRSYD